tara:strand:+ start:296 stop:559 length:264 start_codon:yes stop_codon:yes gene_type:complete
VYLIKGAGMNIDLNEDEVKLLVNLVKHAYADVHMSLDQYDECGNRFPMGSHPAQILSDELSVLRKMERKLQPVTFGTQKKRTVTEVV